MNHGTPQHQDPHAAQHAWPSFADGPAAPQFGYQSPAAADPAPAGAHPYGMAQPQQQTAPPQAWGLAAPQQPQHPHAQHQQHYSGHPQAQQQTYAPGQMPGQVHPHAPHGAPVQMYAQPGQAQSAVAHGAPAQFPPALAPDGSFAFPTPHGVQIVEQAQAGGMATATNVATPTAATRPAAAAAGGKRVRWEVLVPAGTALVLLVTAFVVFTNFDRITGTSATAAKDTGTATQTDDATGAGADLDAGAAPEDDAAAAAPEAAPEYAATDIATAPEPKLDPAQARAAVAKAKELINLGRYDEAKATLAPLASAAGTTPPVVGRMQQQIAAKSKLNDTLLAKLGKQRAAGAWAEVLQTLGAIQNLHPLTDAQAKLAATAAASLKPTAGGGAPAAAKPAKATGGGATATKVPAVARPAKAPTPGAATGGGSASSVGSTPPSSNSAGGAPAQPSVANPSSAPSSIAAQPTAATTDCTAHANMTMHAGHCD